MNNSRLLFLLLSLYALSCTPKSTTTVVNETEEVVQEAVDVVADLIPEVDPTIDSLLDAEIPIADDVHIGQFNNGLRYYIKKNSKPEDKVELRLVVNAGSILESNNQLGLAHFLEHMMFNGTKNFEKNKLVDYLQKKGVKFGAHLNAYTSFDETVYMLSLPSEDLNVVDTGFQILEDWAHNALLTEEEIDKERGVVLEEYRLSLGADKRMMQKYLPKVFYESLYADRLPIGKKEVLETFDYESLRSFYKEWYRPDLMAVIVVGDMEIADAETLIRQHFAHLTNPVPAKERVDYPVPNHRNTLVSVATDPEAPYGIIRLLYKNPYGVEDQDDGTDYKEILKRRLLSALINQRLNELQNLPNPPFVYSQVYYGDSWARTKEAFQAFAVVGEDGHTLGTKTLLEEVKRVKEHGFLESELERAKSAMLTRYEKSYNERDKTESSALVNEYIGNFLQGECIPGIEWEYEFCKKMIPTITLADINITADRFIRDVNRVLVLTGPEKEDLVMPTEEEVLDIVKAVSETPVDAYEEQAVASNLMENWPEAGNVISRDVDTVLHVTDLTLSNGVKVTIKETDFKNDQVLFRAVSKGGTNLIDQSTYDKIYHALGSITDGGINGFDLTALDKYLQGNTARVGLSLWQNLENMRGSASPDDLETLFQLIHLYFTKIDYNEDAYASFRTKQEQIYANLASSPSSYFYNEVGKYLNKDNPRAKGWPTAEDWQKTDYQLAYETFKQRFANAADFHFYFVGNASASVIEELAISYLSSLPTHASEKESFTDLGFRTPSTLDDLTIQKGTDPKSQVIIGYQHEARYSSDDEILLSALSDILDIKLIEVLREEKSGVYGVRTNSMMATEPYDFYSFNISFPCGPENVKQLTKTALTEVDKLVNNGPEQIDIDKVLETNLKEYKKQLKENGFWLGQLQNADLYEYDRQRVLGYPDRIKTLLNKANLQDAAKRFLTKDYVVFTLLPEE